MIGVLILNYKNWNDTIQLVKILINDDDAYIVVVDNDSGSELPSEIKEFGYKKNFRFIQSGHNGGYSYGNNIGFRALAEVCCENILICNCDIEVDPEALRMMARILDRSDSIGIAAPRIKFRNGEYQEIARGVETTVVNKYKFMLRNTPARHFLGGFLKKYYPDPRNISEIQKVHSVSGCCFMINKRAFKTVFPLDEKIFLYNEELLIGDKLAKAGLETVILKNIDARHGHGLSTNQLSFKSFNSFILSEWYYFRKFRNEPLLMLFPLVLVRALQVILKMLRSKNYFIYLLNNGLK